MDAVLGPSERATGDRRAGRLLFVEDDESVAMTLAAILGDEGYAVDRARTVDEALAFVEAGQYDVAVLDLRVGDGGTDDGLVVLERLKEVSPRTVPLIVTGHGSLDSAVKAMRGGAVAYLLKPCDVDELKSTLSLERERRLRMVAEAELVARERSFAVVAHELRTPLTSLKGHVQLLRRECERGAAEGSRVRELGERIAEAVGRLEVLGQDLAEAARLQAGRLVLRTGPAELGALLRTAADQHRELLTAAHALSVDLPPDPVPVVVDRARIHQVLANLLDNAVKYSPAGGTIRVTAGTADGRAVVSVSDDGIGLPAGADATIFEPFERGANAAASGLPGTGLGLHVARAIVEQHGGRIWAESGGEGRGTLVSFSLPLASLPEEGAG